MPTWWIVGVAVYVPLIVAVTVHGIVKGDDEPGPTIACCAFFVASGLASGLFWFG